MKYTLIIVVPLLCLILFACTKEEEIIKPDVTSNTTVSAITGTNAKFGGNIVWKEGFTLKDRGICFSTSPNPTKKNTCVYGAAGIGNYSCTLSGLKFNTTYYVRAFATYTVGETGYGSVVSFTTTNQVSQSTLAFEFLTNSSILCSDSIYSDGGIEITQRGVCYSTTPGPTYPESPYIMNSNRGPGQFSSIIQNLIRNTKYYVRPFLINANGTTYGSEVSLKTLNSGIPCDPVTDIDGNTYNTIQLGDQIWMTENLRTTRYANGDFIATTSGSVNNEENPKYQWLYNNNAANLIPYGRLYTWYTATDIRGIAPEGWRVPSWNDWTKLETYLKENDFAVNKTNSLATVAKAVSSINYWTTSNVVNTPGYKHEQNNFSGLSLTPSGLKILSSFNGIGQTGYYISTANSGEYASSFYINYSVNYTSNGNINKSYGISVRCIKN